MKKRYIVVLIVMIICILSTIKFTYGRFTYESEVTGTVTTTSRNPFNVGTLAYSIVDNAMKAKENTEKTIYSEEPKTKPAVQINGEEERTLSVTEDDLGNSYYFRGNVKDNYIDFSNMCFRIVRIEGDGSIKLILEDKNSTCEKALGGINASIGEYSYGYKQGDISNNMFDYKENLQGKKDNKIGTREVLQSWSKIFDTKNLKLNDWCIGDITNWYDDNGKLSTTKTGNSEARLRMLGLGQNQYSTLNCDGINEEKVNDFVGLLTADDLAFAGSVLLKDNSEVNFTNYLKNTNMYWWLLTPILRDIETDRAFAVKNSGNLWTGVIYGTYHVRPSIVLKSDIKLISGNGTKTNAYKVDENPFEENTLAYEIVKNAQNVKNGETTTNTTKLSPVPESIPAQQVSGVDEKTLSITEDDYGSSYYFRGNIEDNYLNFNNMCWRVVRIQGDGSIKLILYDKEYKCSDAVGGDNAFSSIETVFGSKLVEEKHIMDYINCKENQDCLRRNLQNWFNQNFCTNNPSENTVSNTKPDLKSEYIDKLKYETWNLGDWTTIYSTSGRNLYEPYERLYNNDISKRYVSLKTFSNDTIKVNDYISTLTADEVALAGLTADGLDNANNNNYLSLNSRRNWWLISPSTNNITNGDDVFFVDFRYYLVPGGWVNLNNGGNNRPSIVLNKNIKLTGGDGTKSNPYTIE